MEPDELVGAPRVTCTSNQRVCVMTTIRLTLSYWAESMAVRGGWDNRWFGNLRVRSSLMNGCRAGE